MSEFTATATASATGESTSTATATGNSLAEAINNANSAALASATFSLSPLTQPPADQTTCDNFCLSCIDFRFASNMPFYQSIKGNCNNFDTFILAGASLGYNGIPGYENWTLACDQTIQIAYDLHDISRVDLFDHLDCGAYRLVYTPEQLAGDGAFNLHVENLKKAEATLKAKYPFIKQVNKYIFDLNFEAIPIL